MNVEFFESEMPNFNSEEVFQWCSIRGLLSPEMICQNCLSYMKLSVYKRNKDGLAWRCLTRSCISYSKYISVRIGSFFEGLNIEIPVILKIISKYCIMQPLHSIIRSTSTISGNSVSKIINKLLSRLPPPNFNDNKLGGPLSIVQVDETMLNFKCKSHRGRSSENRTDALVIAETRGITTRIFARIIPNKQAATILPIICEQVLPGSIIHTDEHRSYIRLTNKGFIHATVCHKYNFVNRGAINVHTQHVESINNLIKRHIKNRNGIKKHKRARFLNEMCFFFNNKVNLFEKILELIKI